MSIYTILWSDSLNELSNQVERYKRLNSPSEIGYVYVFAGSLIYGPYQVIGKCSSTESLYSAPQSAPITQQLDMHLYIQITLGIIIPVLVIHHYIQIP